MGKRIYGTEGPLKVISRKDAQEQGKKYYYTGDPCPKGHHAWRLVSSYVCTECRRRVNAAWYSKAKEYYNEASKKHFQENRDYHRERRREYYLQNQERLLAQARDFRNSEEGAAYTRSQAALQNAMKAQATTAWSDLQKIRDIYKQAKKLERELGLELRVDHYYPLRGRNVCGLHVPENLRIITKDENSAKSNKHPEDWELEKMSRGLYYPRVQPDQENSSISLPF